jgi:hypothetical protein
MKPIVAKRLAAGWIVGSILLGSGSALAQASRQEYPIPRNPSEDLTAIERIFTPPKPAPLTAFAELRERWKDTPAFLRDSKVSIDARSYYRDAVRPPGSTGIQEAWAGGGSINYYSQDLLNIFYTEGKVGHDFGGGFTALAAAQFVAQNTTGQTMINGGNAFATNQLGMKVDLGYRTGILTLGYSVTNPGLGILTPWSANPFYTDGLIQGFQRAGEQVVMIGLSHT